MVDSSSQGRLENFSKCNFTHQLPSNICKSGLRSRRRSLSSQKSSKSSKMEPTPASKGLKQSKSAKTLILTKSMSQGTFLNYSTLTAQEEQKKISHVLKKSRNKDFLGISDLLNTVGTQSQETLEPRQDLTLKTGLKRYFKPEKPKLYRTQSE